MDVFTNRSRRSPLYVALAVAGLTLAATGCTNDTIDDGDSPDVVLEVESFEGPEVTAALQGGGQGGSGQECRLQATEWSMTLRNVPKTDLAGPDSSPFNDIILDSMTVNYVWFGLPGGAAAPASDTIGLGGVTIEPDGTGTVTFFPIGNNALATDTTAPTGEPDLAGTSAAVNMLIRAHTVENEQILLPVTRNLNVQVCPPSTGP
jgi:hypothetical protein